jgi:two-component sensor histidine kinase/PAS domain-containing protein
VRSRFRATSFLGTLLAATIISSLGVTAVVLEGLVRGELGRQAGEGNRLLAASVAHEMYSFLELHFVGLSLLGPEGLRDGRGPELLQRSYPAFESVLVADAAGRVTQASASSEEAGFDLSARDYFRVPFRSQRDFVSPAFISETRYAPSSVLARPFPDRVAIAYISLSFMSDYIARLPSSESKSIAIVDSRGAYVARNGAASGGSQVVSLEPWFRDLDPDAASGLSEVRRPDGVEELLCWAAVPGASGWKVIVSEPAERVFRAVHLLRVVLTAAIAACALVSLLLTLGVMRLVRVDIEALIRFSRRIADGKLDSTLDFRGFLDLSLLAGNLERMGQAIRERESLLKANERRLYDLLDFLPIPVVLLTRDLRVELMNRALTRSLGWTLSDIGDAEEWWRKVYPEEGKRGKAQEFWAAYTGALLSGGRPEEAFRGSLACKDGSSRTMIGEAALISERFIVTFVDITEADAAAARTEASLREKEVLLKEIHHRVKNNLQIIVSLLWLKATADPGTTHLFTESIDRIQVMAAIHELLYRSGDLSHIDLSEYVENLVGTLVSTYSASRTRPALDLRLEPVELDIDLAIPCGLIMNEVITNSLKYAFPPGRAEPRIGVALSRSEGGRILLELYDNGIGLPPSFDASRGESLGTQLIISLCEQMRGTWKLESAEGTRWRIEFGG